jgi:hypothetical protein
VAQTKEALMRGFERKPGGTSLVQQRANQVADGAPGRRTLVDQIYGVQRRAVAPPDPAAVHDAAAQGVATSASLLPHGAAIQQAFGHHDISGVQAHTGPQAAASAGAMGAEAYATGDHVVLGRGTDLHTVAHEAAHVVQQRGGVQLKGGVGQVGDAYELHADAVADAVVQGKSAEGLLDATPGSGGGGPAVQQRSATRVERRAWLAFFDHYMPRLFLNNYMDDAGAAVTMTQKQMQDCNPMVDIRRSAAFMAQIARLQAAGGGTEAVKCNGWGGALTNGTLGNFTIHWNGNVEVRKDGTWTFTGTVDFYDFWDFDPKGSGSGRPWPAEVKVRVANTFLPGKPFDIFSERVAASQTSIDTQATWPSSIAHVGDRAGRTGADMVVGDVAGGPEVGAQSSEDLNK